MANLRRATNAEMLPIDTALVRQMIMATDTPLNVFGRRVLGPTGDDYLTAALRRGRMEVYRLDKLAVALGTHMASLVPGFMEMSEQWAEEGAQPVDHQPEDHGGEGGRVRLLHPRWRPDRAALMAADLNPRPANFGLVVNGLRCRVTLEPFVPVGRLSVHPGAPLAEVNPKTDMAQIVDGKHVKWAPR